MAMNKQPAHWRTYLLEGVAPLLRQSDLSIVLTGATGWLGRVSLGMLATIFGAQTPARVRAFSSQPRVVELGNGVEIVTRPLDELVALPKLERYLFLHYAYLTRDKLLSMESDSFLAANAAIREQVMRAAEAVDVAGMFIPSSGAVYRSDGTLETDPRANPYGFMKLQDEAIFAALCKRIACPLTVVRVFNLGGPFINKVDIYALSSILLDVSRGGPIRLRSAHPVIRSYVDVRDLVRIILCSLLDLDREPAMHFETAGEREVEVGELAQLAAEVLTGGPMRVERPPRVAQPVDRYVGEGSQLRRLAERYDVRLKTLPDQIRDTAAYLKETAIAS